MTMITQYAVQAINGNSVARSSTKTTFDLNMLTKSTSLTVLRTWSMRKYLLELRIRRRKKIERKSLVKKNNAKELQDTIQIYQHDSFPAHN